MIRLLSPWSRVVGRASRSLVRGRVKEVCAVSEGAMFAYVTQRSASELGEGVVKGRELQELAVQSSRRAGGPIVQGGPLPMMWRKR